MKSYLAFWGLVLGLFLGASTCFGQSATYQASFQKSPLIEVIKVLEKDYDLLFSYEEQQIRSTTISLKYGTNELDQFLDKIFQQTSLDFERVNDRFVVLVPREQGVENAILRSFCGLVRDSLTLAPLPYANAYLLKNAVGATTQQDGRFCFNAPNDITDTLVVSYVGYREFRLSVNDFLALSMAEIQLSYFDFGEDFVVVTDYLSDGVHLDDAGFATALNPRRMRTLPGKVEPDILEALQNLPGISSPDGALANLHIRGSTPDQNLILWEDIPIYHSAHYFGTISAFNPYAIDEVKVYRGGFGAEYGGRIAGVVDMRVQPFKAKENRIGLGTNLLTSFLDGQLKMPGNGGVLRVSLRRSMTEVLSSPYYRQLSFRNHQSLLAGNFSANDLPDGISVTEDFNFVDTQLKYAVDLSKRDQITFSYLWARNNYNNIVSDDRRGQDNYNDLYVENQGWSTSWQRRWTPFWSTQLTALGTHHDYNYQFTVDKRNPSLGDDFGRRDNDIQEHHLKLSTNYQLPSKANMLVGYQITNYDLGYEIVEKEQEVNLANQTGGSASLLHTLFATYQTNAQQKTGVHLGFRVNRYANTGSLYWEPRLQLWHQFNPSLRWQVAAGKYYQFVSQLNEFKGANIGISSPIWVLADERAPVINAVHWQTGLLYEKEAWLIDAQLYAKESKGLSALAIGFLPRPSQGFDLGSSSVRGFDLLVKKRWAGFSTWLSYSLSNVTYKFPTFFDPVFAAPFDQLHRLFWAGTYRRGRWEYSLSWQINSGVPYSLLEDFEIITPQGGQEVIRPIYEAFNAQRLSAQHQLNAAIVYTLNVKTPDKWVGMVGLSFLNIYNQTNTYEREYFINNRPNMPLGILFEDSIQIGFTPSFVVRVEWK
jgi:hypothetical protein